MDLAAQPFNKRKKEEEECLFGVLTVDPGSKNHSILDR